MKNFISIITKQIQSAEDKANKAAKELDFVRALKEEYYGEGMAQAKVLYEALLADQKRREEEQNKGQYKVVRKDGVEYYDAEKVRSCVFSGKKLKDMNKEELMIHLYELSEIIGAVDNLNKKRGEP